jgi:hypothetical protein
MSETISLPATAQECAPYLEPIGEWGDLGMLVRGAWTEQEALSIALGGIPELDMDLADTQEVVAYMEECTPVRGWWKQVAPSDDEIFAWDIKEAVEGEVGAFMGTFFQRF